MVTKVLKIQTRRPGNLLNFKKRGIHFYKVNLFDLIKFARL